ncbi:hypothetical protein KDA_65130 [Dictyobacter alpinus]|uniref:Uncharacterized protein n=1 Tax=Dictyobacter alpinus TaxID=2014873 RepID=A0A402BI54_9CHLR|nr:hypothetical protein [Dictyobacter alpinus]GCE31029.1 hypothetical protein KDA_65130 [Dictyobacter alpinus]
MLTLPKPGRAKDASPIKKPGKPRFSPLMLISAGVTAVLILIAGIVIIVPRLASHAADANANCSLIVPRNPLSARGLATPYQLVATDPNMGPCNEANAGQAAFVQGAVIDPATGAVSVYNPLVVDKGTQPGTQPVVPKLPANAVVGLWFGFNGDNLTLQDKNGSLGDGRCVNGTNNSIFGQFAYCNARAFFAAANTAIQRGKLTPPALGMAADGMTCPTVRDFSVIDMDQSDNVTTTYLVTADGKTAQNTAANITQLKNAQTQINGSDNRLLSIALDGALNCQPWMAPDLADNGKMVPALPLNELQAAAHQAAPMAVVPLGDPMALNNGNQDANKMNLYRRGVDQLTGAAAADKGDTATYCKNYLAVAPARIQLDAQFTKNRPSPDPAAANNLFTFLAQRFNAGFGDGGLNCTKLINAQSPITVTTDGNGVATDATIALNNGNGNGNGNGNNGAGNGQAAAPNCSVNGTVINGCTGTTQINNQTCQVAFDKAANQVNLTCPATPNQGQQNPPGGQQPQPTATQTQNQPGQQPQPTATQTQNQPGQQPTQQPQPTQAPNQPGKKPYQYQNQGYNQNTQPAQGQANAPTSTNQANPNCDQTPTP